MLLIIAITITRRRLVMELANHQACRLLELPKVFGLVDTLLLSGRNTIRSSMRALLLRLRRLHKFCFYGSFILLLLLLTVIVVIIRAAAADGG